MEYVEILRVRRALVIFAIAIGSIELIDVLAYHFGSLAAAHAGGHLEIRVGSSASHARPIRDVIARAKIPLELLVGIAGYGAIIFATVLAASLNKENGFAHFAFTKPISRQRLALRHFAIDAAGVLAAFAIVSIAIVSAFAFEGGLDRVVFATRAISVAFLALGVGFMWYGILQAATAAYRGKGGAIVGWSWAIFGLLIGVRDQPFLGPFFGALVRVADVVNPFAYAPQILDDGRGGALVSTLNGSIEAQGTIAWCIAVVSCALAVWLWKRVEV